MFPLMHNMHYIFNKYSKRFVFLLIIKTGLSISLCPRFE